MSLASRPLAQAFCARRANTFEPVHVHISDSPQGVRINLCSPKAPSRTPLLMEGGCAILTCPHVWVTVRNLVVTEEWELFPLFVLGSGKI